jgi:hypothetical protein
LQAGGMTKNLGKGIKLARRELASAEVACAAGRLLSECIGRRRGIDPRSLPFLSIGYGRRVMGGCSARTSPMAALISLCAAPHLPPPTELSLAAILYEPASAVDFPLLDPRPRARAPATARGRRLRASPNLSLLAVGGIQRAPFLL